jgi:hypothetical protein
MSEAQTPQTPPADRHAAARALFESVPNIRFAEIAQQVGCAVADVRAWRKADAAAGHPWQIAHEWDEAALGERAMALAAKFREMPADALQGPQADEVATEAEREARAVADFSTTVGVQVRAELLARHQQEWVGPRALIYQAMRVGKSNPAAGFELGKLAKIAAETLTLVQAGELRSHGIKPGEASDAPLVVIDRTGD